MSIELNEALQQALDAEKGDPLRLVDPRTKEVYVLLRAEEYDRWRQAAPPPPPHPEDELEIPEGIRRSRDAFLRDLPDLLRNPRHEGWWVAYHGDERVAMAWDPNKVRREIFRRGLKAAEYYLGIIQSYQPEEEEEIERSFYEFDDEEPEEPAGPTT
jgi:hypothetical protein